MSSAEIFLYTLIVMGAIGLIGASILYLTAKKFRVEEDPRIDEVEGCLPGANCGACGRKGCRDFAAECVRRGNLDGLACPGAGSEGMRKIAAILGAEASDTARKVAVIKCNGDCTARPEVYIYDGAVSCAVMDSVGCGTTACSYGCLGCGDCVSACSFEAIRIDPSTHLPVIDTDVCTGCGLCAAECPRNIIELRPAGCRDRRVWVACSSRDKGALARKICSSACIGCGKCSRVCAFSAVSLADNLSYIDPELCKTCGKCAGVCPTGAIHATFEIIKKAEV